jgi:hypothetical protein
MIDYCSAYMTIEAQNGYKQVFPQRQTVNKGWGCNLSFRGENKFTKQQKLKIGE